jgi:hypothetical protein
MRAAKHIAILDFSVKRTKEYRAHADKSKLWINKTFADNVMHFLGKGAMTMLLDTARGITTNTMQKAGFSLNNITAPNINIADCQALTKLGVFAPHMSIEQCIQTCGINHNAAFLDSMTTLGGSATFNHYNGVFVHHFLRQNRKNNCVLAVTICTRSNTVACNIMAQKEIFKRQIRALIAYHGFDVDSEFVINYKKGLCFGMWNLIPNSNVEKLPFLTWKKSDRLIGFPEGFTKLHLSTN